MKFYFDTNMAKIDVPEENMVVFYSSYLHNLLKVNTIATAMFDYIICKGVGQEISCEEMAGIIPELEPGDVQEIFDELSISGLFFTSLGEYHSNCFKNIFQSTLKSDIKEIYFHLTYRCNLACEYCYNKNKLNSTAELKLEQWKQIVDDLKKRSHPRIYFTGGEPTLYKDFTAVVDYVYEAGLQMELLTNGTMLHQISDKTLKKLSSITVSLDNIGDDKTYRKNSEKYNVIDNILMVHSKGVKINVRSVVSNDTIEETNEVKKYFSRYDINYISSIYIPNAPDEICKVPLQIAPESVDEYYSMQDVGRCGACFQVLAIDPSGNIYPCQSLMKNEFILGNVEDRNWLDIVKKHNLTNYFLYRTVEQIDICRDCKVRTICGGGCPAISYHVYNSLEHRLDYFCDFLKRDSEYCIMNTECN